MNVRARHALFFRLRRARPTTIHPSTHVPDVVIGETTYIQSRGNKRALVDTLSFISVVTYDGEEITSATFSPQIEIGRISRDIESPRDGF